MEELLEKTPALRRSLDELYGDTCTKRWQDLDEMERFVRGRAADFSDIRACYQSDVDFYGRSFLRFFKLDYHESRRGLRRAEAVLRLAHEVLCLLHTFRLCGRVLALDELAVDRALRKVKRLYRSSWW